MANVSTMVKRVNVYARIPIRTVFPNLYGHYQKLNMSPANILKCLTHKAVIDEILDDGTLVRLDMKNYNKDNSHLQKKFQNTKPDTLESAVKANEPAGNSVKIIKETETTNVSEQTKSESTEKVADGAGTEASQENKGDTEVKKEADVKENDGGEQVSVDENNSDDSPSFKKYNKKHK